jgi:hypothetical protein
MIKILMTATWPVMFIMKPMARGCLLGLRGEHFGDSLTILQCKCSFVQIKLYTLHHLRFELSLESMRSASGPSFPYLRFLSFPTFPIIV